MIRYLVVVAAWMIVIGVVVAKPAGGPLNPHGTGKEPTPVEREFHLALPGETALTQSVPQRPRKLADNEVWHLLRVFLPWANGM